MAEPPMGRPLPGLGGASSCQRELAYVAGIQMCKFISCLKAQKLKMSAIRILPLSIPRVPPFSLPTLN
ncbi:unnamed protein product, partial [Bubo scandiacus]